MSDYKELVKSEAKAYHDKVREAYESDAGEFGGKSSAPNLLKWIDKQESLSARISEISTKWTTKDFHWVQVNTRNKNTPGGDPRSNAFASLLQDVRQELKKIAKAK